MNKKRKYCRLVFRCLLVLGFISARPAVSQEVRMLEPDSFYISMHLAVEPLLVDVRPARDYRKERIPDAVSAPRSQKLFRLTDSLDAEHPIYLYCDDESRSGQAAEMLLEKGFSNLIVLKNGLLGWKLTGLPVDDRRRRR